MHEMRETLESFHFSKVIAGLVLITCLLTGMGHTHIHTNPTLDKASANLSMETGPPASFKTCSPEEDSVPDIMSTWLRLGRKPVKRSRIGTIHHHT